MKWLILLWLCLWLPRRIGRLAAGWLPNAERPELLLTFGLASLVLGVALWRSADDMIAFAFGWFILSALSIIGYRIAAWLCRNR